MTDRVLPDFAAIIQENSILHLLTEVIKANQAEAYVVGGFVRDLILRRNQKNDIDIVVVGSGITLAEQIKKALGSGASLSVYKTYGTAAIKYQDFEIEFVGARKESYNHDSRNPIVENGTLEDDQNRRDFTINALAVSLQEHNLGQLLDPFDGMGDLQRKMIRTPLNPDITFSDDPLRIMRAIRFAAQLGFDIEPDIWDGILRQKERLKIVSQERITTELNRIIMCDVPSYGFNLLFHSGVLAIIFPEMTKLHGVQKVGNKAHKDNFYHTLKVLDNICATTDDLWVRWSAILHDIAKPATQKFDPKVGWTFHGHEDLGARWVPRIFKNLKLPLGEPMHKVQNLVKLHLRPIALVNAHVTDSAIRRLLFDAGNDFDDLMLLCRADITSKDANKVSKYLLNFDRLEEKIRALEERDHIRNLKLVVTGDMIMSRYGINPSREVGVLKEALKEAVLDGKIENHIDQALLFLDKKAQQIGIIQNTDC